MKGNLITNMVYGIHLPNECFYKKEVMHGIRSVHSLTLLYSDFII